MSPTVLRRGPYRFYFFSREENRPHVHVESATGEAKFWLEPLVSLATSTGLGERQLRVIQKILETKRDAILKAWNTHFKKP
jgi:hypothetical protein